MYKVSVIIPVYNAGPYIEQCVYSVITQKTNFDFEIIVGDDCSTDLGTESILKRMSSMYDNIKYYRHQTNTKGKENIKFLLSQCKGKYIAYLDGDDFWIDMNKLQRQVDFLELNPEYSLTFTGHYRYGIRGLSYPSDSFIHWDEKSGDMTTTDIINNNSIASPTKVFVNYFDDNWKDYFYDAPFFDWVHNFYLSRMGKVRYLNFPSAVYRIHPNGVFALLTQEERQIKNDLSRKLFQKILEK